jgi:hypothetical protein
LLVWGRSCVSSHRCFYLASSSQSVMPVASCDTTYSMCGEDKRASVQQPGSLLSRSLS